MLMLYLRLRGIVSKYSYDNENLRRAAGPWFMEWGCFGMQTGKTKERGVRDGFTGQVKAAGYVIPNSIAM